MIFKEILQDTYKSNLKMYQKMQKEDPVYPVVSLFNLEDDPQETTNLADNYPELVEELLKEAEEAIEDAPLIFQFWKLVSQSTKEIAVALQNLIPIYENFFIM